MHYFPILVHFKDRLQPPLPYWLPLSALQYATVDVLYCSLLPLTTLAWSRNTRLLPATSINAQQDTRLNLVTFLILRSGWKAHNHGTHSHQRSSLSLTTFRVHCRTHLFAQAFAKWSSGGSPAMSPWMATTSSFPLFK